MKKIKNENHQSQKRILDKQKKEIIITMNQMKIMTKCNQ
jgi:hypothetical protein